MSVHAKSGLWVDNGGDGDHLVLLLHGIGATGAVWHGVGLALAARGMRWMAPDLMGHGGSPSDGPFGFGNQAAALSVLIADQDAARITVLGHSFGGAVGAALCSGLFGPVPARLIALGVKLDWADDEIAAAHAMAARPGKVFATRAEALERYLKVSGLHGLVTPDAPQTARGVSDIEGGYSLTLNPQVFSAVGPSVPDLMRAARAALTLTAGAMDSMVTLTAMRAVSPGAFTLDGLPHNAHVVAPDRIADLVTE